VTNCILAEIIVLYNLCFCLKVFSKYSQLLGASLIMMCITFAGITWMGNITSTIDLFMQSAWFSFSVTMFLHIYRLEMSNRKMELHTRTSRYLVNDFYNKTYIFKDTFLNDFWVVKNVKALIRKKIIFLEYVSWFLFLTNILCILIIKLGK
jgi:hypothetical protein